MAFPFMRAVQAAFFLLLAANPIPLRAADAPAAPTPGVVTVDLHQTVVAPTMGFGVQWDPYSYPPSPADWQLTLKRLDFLRPGFFRVMFNADYCLDYDAQGQPEYIWDHPEKASVYAKSQMAMITQILDYAQKRRVDVMLGEWEWRHDIPGAPPITMAADPRWARMITDLVTYLTRTRHYTILKYYNYMNEPNGSWMGPVNYDAWAQGIRQLHADFAAAGLTQTAIVGPDNSGDWDWLDRSAHDLASDIGDWEMHWYPDDDTILQDKIETLLNDKRTMLLQIDPNALKKRWYMGEAGDITGRMNGDQQPRVKTFDYGVLMADYAAQILRAGWMGASAWDLDDAMHTVTKKVVPPVATTLKVWGFWNTQADAMGNPSDLNIRPWFYTWSLLSRLFPKGTRVVAATEPADSDAFRAVACTGQSGRHSFLSVMLVNDANASRTISVRVPGAGRHTLTVYHYFQDDRPVNADGFPVPQGTLVHADLDHGISLTLPSRGVIFLTNAP